MNSGDLKKAVYSAYRPWYFGDGAELIGLSSSLDPIFAKSKPIVEPQQQMFGFRASRTLTKWIAAEFTFDRGGKLAITDNALTQIEAARASFKNKWKRLDVAGNTPTSSVSTISPYGPRQIFTTGALVLNLPEVYKVSPFLTAGAGIVSSSDGMPAVTLVGSYGGPSALETDTVRLTFAQASHHVFAQVLGGGVKIYVTRHWGFRFDTRAYLYHKPVTILLDANHTDTSDAAWIINATDASGTIVTFLQRITGPGLGSYSALSGPSISGLKVFSGSGIQRQIPITVGLFWRF
jgi:hypothetical protein